MSYSPYESLLENCMRIKNKKQVFSKTWDLRQKKKTDEIKRWFALIKIDEYFQQVASHI